MDDITIAPMTGPLIFQTRFYKFIIDSFEII